MLNIQTKRGCPYDCIYCLYPSIDGRCVRTMDPEAIAENILRAKRDYGISYLFFTDSVFNIGPEYNVRLAETLIRRGTNASRGALLAAGHRRRADAAVPGFGAYAHRIRHRVILRPDAGGLRQAFHVRRRRAGKPARAGRGRLLRPLPDPGRLRRHARKRARNDRKLAADGVHRHVPLCGHAHLPAYAAGGAGRERGCHRPGRRPDGAELLLHRPGLRLGRGPQRSRRDGQGVGFPRRPAERAGRYAAAETK
ncbi:MAG: radical SAM protein [Alistipes sp.]